MNMADTHMVAAPAISFPCQTPHQWPQRDGLRLSPASAAQVAEILKTASENRTPVALTEESAGLLEFPVWLDLSGLQAIRRHAVEDFMITVETGMTVEALNQAAHPHQQEWPLRYLPETRLFEILGEDRPSLEAGLRGYPRDWVLKCEVATPDGLIVVSGADVVKNVTGYDLNKLYVGSGHTLAVITAVTLKLGTRPPERMLWLAEPPTLAEARELADNLQRLPLPFTLLELSRSPRLKKSRRKAGWHVVFQLEGDRLFLDEAKAMLAETFETERFKEVRAGQGYTYWSTLSGWPEDAVVMEAVLPLGAWPAFTDEVLNGLSDQALVQVRPAAGLVYAGWPSDADNFMRAETLHELAQAQNGFIQCHHAPTHQWNVMSRYTLPEPGPQRRLMDTLKQGYDPQNILFNPRYAWNVPS